MQPRPGDNGDDVILMMAMMMMTKMMTMILILMVYMSSTWAAVQPRQGDDGYGDDQLVKNDDCQQDDVF